MLMYDLKAGGQDKATTDPRHHVVGGKVGLGFIAGVTLDPIRREMYTVNNDGGGLIVHSYDAQGDVAPVRKLTVPHQSWGLSLDLQHDELAVTSQQYPGGFRSTSAPRRRPTVRSVPSAERRPGSPIRTACFSTA